ncbi:MAG TPA: bestrophin family ion channel [Acidobacteriaceae bacterium]|jgi:putative membrane protein|nr:bestrophin family ion channel [Acidobacteriaceae bacterium]
MIAYVGLPVLALVLWDLAIVVAYKVLHWEWVGSRHVPLTLYGSAIGVIVGFRNNSAYGRWWEARTLWGAIVNNSRSFARQVTATLRAPAQDADLLRETQRWLVHHQIAYVHALRRQLRGEDPLAVLPGILEPDEIETLRGEKNVALTLQQRMGSRLRDCRDRNWVDSIEWQAMDGNLDDLADAQGGTERIKNTPMPKQYDYFPQLFVQIYCLVLPVGLVETLGWFTPLGSTLVGFMFLALDKIGRDLEDPFDNTVFDVPMTAICKTIEINLRQLLGETELPDPEKPIHGVLW